MVTFLHSAVLSYIMSSIISIIILHIITYGTRETADYRGDALIVDGVISNNNIFKEHVILLLPNRYNRFSAKEQRKAKTKMDE